MELFEDKNVRGKYLALVCNSLHHCPTSVESDRPASAAGKIYQKTYP